VSDTDDVGGQIEPEPPSNVVPHDDAHELAERLKARLGEIIHEPRKQLEVTQAVVEIVATSHHGPLPPSWEMREYEIILPGAATRIIAMAEREQAHRHSWEQKALAGRRWYSMTGMVGGILVALSCAIGAVVAAALGHEVVGAALVAVPACGMVWKLIEGRSRESKQGDDLFLPQPQGKPQPPRRTSPSRKRSRVR
jgi:uncharacterized membrane protein